MHRKLVLMVAVACVLAFSASGFAQPPFTAACQVMYDGYLHETAGQVLADTLIVANNGYSSKGMQVWIEIFDKYGELVNEGTLLNGGDDLVGNTIPPRGYGWTTMGYLVNRDTHDPWGLPGAEKFTFVISSNKKTKPPIIEVKQVIYNGPQQYPAEAIWQPANIKTWAETCLAGLKGPGVIKVPNKMQ